MRTVLSILSLAVAACASAPGVNPPDVDVTLPEGWSAGPAGTAPADTLWWRAFNDETLTGLVADALARNHNLQVSAARVRAAAARARIAGAPLYPMPEAGPAGPGGNRTSSVCPSPDPETAS